MVLSQKTLGSLQDVHSALRAHITGKLRVAIPLRVVVELLKSFQNLRVLAPFLKGTGTFES